MAATALAQSERNAVEESEEARAEDLTSLLVFRAGPTQPKAVPLSLVSRLEKIDCRRIEISDGRHLVQYRGQLMPLLRIDAQTGIKQEGAQPILVFSDDDRSMGPVVVRSSTSSKSGSISRWQAIAPESSVTPW